MNRPEEAIQRTVSAALDATGVLWCHVPNGGRRSKAEAGVFKALGVKPGVPDVMIFTPPPNMLKSKGAAMELKSAAGRLSEPQAEWLNRLSVLGWEVALVYSVDEALLELERWGYLAARRTP